jgi:long-chain acyl-CoA synthetase
MAANHFGTLSVAAILEESARRHPQNVAVILGDETISYERLWGEARAYAGGLRSLGIGQGDAVAMMLPNTADFPRVYYAVLALGATVVPVHTLLRAPEIAHVLSDSGARLIVCSEAFAEAREGAAIAGVTALTVGGGSGGSGGPADTDARLEELATSAPPLASYVPLAPEAVATILYTSGTTGVPKGAEGSHFALVEQVNQLLFDAIPILPTDRVLGALPLFHTFGQTCTMNTIFRAGATLVLLPRFEADAALQTMVEHQCTVFMGVPTMFVALLQAGARSASRPPLRYSISGGAAIPTAVLEQFGERFGAPVHEGYGLTETSPVVTFNRVGVPPRAGTVGTPLWGVEVGVADPLVDDQILFLAPGDVGELVVRGHCLMLGYRGRPEDTAKTIVDGWLRTGDLARVAADGYVTIVDRKKDMIVRNGYNVYPREVEEVLARHPSVAAVAVFGVPDPLHGEEVAAAAVLRAADVTSEDLIEYVRRQVAPYKFPRHLEIVDALPLGPSGKVLKRELAARWAQRMPVDRGSR